MSLLHRLLQRRWAQEAIPDTPAEPASAPAALPSIDDAAALERLSSRHIAPIHERLYNNTYQADANALLEQLETTAPAALQPFTSSPTQPPPQLAADPSSLSESKSPPTRATASVSERTPLLQPPPSMHPAVAPHTLTSPATPSEPGFRVTLSPMQHPMPPPARSSVVPHHTTQLQPIDSSDEDDNGGKDASSDDDDDEDDDEEEMMVSARSERKTAHDEAEVQMEKAAFATGLSPSALSPSPLNLEAHPLQETEKAHLQRLTELAQRQMQRQAQQGAHWRRDHLLASSPSDRFCVFMSATKWIVVVAAIAFICVALFLYFHNPHTSHAHMRRIRDGEHAAMSKHHRGIPAWPSRPQPHRQAPPDAAEEDAKHKQQSGESLQTPDNTEIHSRDRQSHAQGSVSKTERSSSLASRLRLRLPLRTRG